MISTKMVYHKFVKISDELADFLRKPRGYKMTRHEATCEIEVYILFKRLANENERNFRYDYNLYTLMKGSEDSEKLTFSNFQKHLRQHFTH